MRLSTRIDRYPAKMVAHLADDLVNRYAANAKRLLDPFCGSGAVLTAALRKGIPVSGIDINPIAGLFCNVKLHGFCVEKSRKLAEDVVKVARSNKRTLCVEWPDKHYWFTPGTLSKFENLRAAFRACCLSDSNDGMAVLLSYALSVRLCSKADQRSPKPFISKNARASRKGRHFDPYIIMLNILDELAAYYGAARADKRSFFYLGDITGASSSPLHIGKHSHVITSPPYINAQDYYRNFKLELYLLEGILPGTHNDIKARFIGTERGKLLLNVPEYLIEANYEILPSLRILQTRNPRSAAVVHRYLVDMDSAFNNIKKHLMPGAYFILVCGDNLISGIRIPTWRLLQSMLEMKGFKQFDQFTDKIDSRVLPPKRCGHKGLIKEEVICAFQLS